MKVDAKAGPVPAEREIYSPADVEENPTLSDMATAALDVLSKRSQTFWLMIEAGDVDWANHANNIDNSIGAVISGDDAFRAVTDWIEHHGGWDDTVVILTADHGHYFMLDQPEMLVPRQASEARQQPTTTGPVPASASAIRRVLAPAGTARGPVPLNRELPLGG